MYSVPFVFLLFYFACLELDKNQNIVTVNTTAYPGPVLLLAVRQRGRRQERQVLRVAQPAPAQQILFPGYPSQMKKKSQTCKDKVFS